MKVLFKNLSCSLPEGSRFLRPVNVDPFSRPVSFVRPVSLKPSTFLQRPSLLPPLTMSPTNVGDKTRCASSLSIDSAIGVKEEGDVEDSSLKSPLHLPPLKPVVTKNAPHRGTPNRGAYDWQQHVSESKIPPLDELKPSENVEKQKLKKSGFVPFDSTGIDDFYKLKKSKKDIPIQLPSPEFIAHRNLNPDDLSIHIRKPIVQSLKNLEKVKTQFPSTLATLKDVVFTIVDIAIKRQTGLDKALSEDEVKQMVLAASQMLADGFNPDRIGSILTQAHRGQVVRVQSEKDQVLSFATFSGVEAYDRPLGTLEDQALRKVVPSYLARPEGLSRKDQSEPFFVPQRNSQIDYKVRSGTEGYVFAVAPEVPEAVLQAQAGSSTGGAMRFIPLFPELLEIVGTKRVVSATLRHRLQPIYQEQIIQDAHKAVNDKGIAQVELEKEDLRSSKLGHMYKSIKPDTVTQKALLEKIPELISSESKKQAKFVGVSTKIIYMAVDSVLKDMGYEPNEVPLSIRLDCWRGIERELASDKSLIAPGVELVKDLASLVVSLGEAVPIPFAEKAMSVLDTLGNQTVSKILDWMVEKCAKPGQIKVIRFDGQAQKVQLTSELDSRLGKAIDFLDKLLEKGDSAKEKLESTSLPDSFAFLSGAVDSSLEILAKVSVIGPSLRGLLSIVRDVANIVSSSKSLRLTSEIRQQIQTMQKLREEVKREHELHRLADDEVV